MQWWTCKKSGTWESVWQTGNTAAALCTRAEGVDGARQANWQGQHIDTRRQHRHRDHAQRDSSLQREIRLANLAGVRVSSRQLSEPKAVTSPAKTALTLSCSGRPSFAQESKLAKTCLGGRSTARSTAWTLTLRHVREAWSAHLSRTSRSIPKHVDACQLHNVCKPPGPSARLLDSVQYLDDPPIKRIHLFPVVSVRFP